MIAMWIRRDPRIVFDGRFLKQDLEQAYDAESKRCTITYLNSAGRPVSMDFDTMTHRLFAMSFDPYQCIERRWGAQGPEAASCPTDADKTAWYRAEQRLRNDPTPEYDVTMNFTRADLERRAPGSGIDQPPDIDIQALIEGVGPQVPFTGMATVGR